MNAPIRQVVSVIVAAAQTFAGLGCSSGSVASLSSAEAVTLHQVIKTYAGIPSEKLRAGQLAELSIAHFLRGDHENSIASATIGLSKAISPEQKAGFYALIAQNHGALGRNEEAGQAALAGQRHSPNNKLLAVYRLANFERSGNRVQAEIARTHLTQIDSDFALNPTLEPITAGVILVSVLIAGATVVAVVGLKEAGKAETEEKRKSILEAIKPVIAVFGGALGISAGMAFAAVGDAPK